jgi:hypothetical protein
LHPPAFPQVATGCAGHCFKGSVPAAIGPQVPSLPLPFNVAVHASQDVLQAVSQHTPSTQLPVLHSPHWPATLQSVWRLQVAPLAFSGVHCPCALQ